MIDDKIILQIEDTLIHKKLVIDSGYKMCKYLFENDKNELAFCLLDRIIQHDNSKFSNEELYELSYIKDNNSLLDPTVLLSSEQQKQVEIHWKNNRHHPEYFNNTDDMEEIDIIEMCCDWHARSIQYNTNLMDFVIIRQKNRFHFSEEIYTKIINYCSILLN